MWLGKELKLHLATLFLSFTVMWWGGIVNNKLHDLTNVSYVRLGAAGSIEYTHNSFPLHTSFGFTCCSV